MAIGQSFGPQFGYQTMIPKKEKKEELQSRMFPGLDDGQSKRLIETVDKLGITDTSEKLKKQQEIYKEVLPQIKAKEAQMNRQVIKNEQYNATLDTKDPKQKAVKMAGLKMEDLADMIKEKYDLDPNAPTDGIISEYNTMLNDMGIDEKLVEDYMNGKSDELLYATELKARPEDNTAKDIGDFFSGKPIDTSREVSQFLDPLNKKGTGGADPTTALNLVGKGLLNLIPNTVSFVKGVGSMIFHPRQTVEGLKSMGQGIIDQSQGETDTPQAQMVAGMWDSIKETVTDPQKLGQFISENPLDIITAISPKGTLQLVKEAGKLGTKGVKATTKAIQTIGKAKPLATDINEARLLAGKIIQGDTADITPALKTLANVDTKGVKTYGELSSRLSTKEKSLMSAVDDILSADKNIYKSNNFDTITTVGNTTIKQNYVKQGLDHLEEMYKTISDPVNEAKIIELKNKFNTEGLSLLETNNIARQYSAEFGKKAFSKMGDPLTSVNAQSYENIRKGIKNTVREKLPTDEARLLDKQYSDVANTKISVDKMVEKVNSLSQKINKRGFIERVGRLVGRTIDTVTGGGLRGILTSFLPSNIGNKVMNSLDLQESLSKNLQRLEKFVKNVDDGKLTKAELDLFLKQSKNVASTTDNIVNPIVQQPTKVAQTKTPPKLPTKNESISRPVVRMKAPEPVIETLNPTGKIFTDYTPEQRLNAKLGKNITTLDKTSGMKPDDMITVYRGTKGSEINPGDFITTNKQLAKDYIGNGNVVEKKVRVGDILDDITEPLGEEYIYRPAKQPKPLQAKVSNPVVRMKAPEGETLYHGGLSKIDTFDIGFAKTANYGKGIYFSDNPTMAKYYSMIKKDADILGKGFDPKTGEYPKRGLGEVTDIKLSNNAKIKQLPDNPTIKDIEQAKTEGFDGVKFKDTIKKEDWNTDLLGAEPKNANTTMIFNDKVIQSKGLTPKISEEPLIAEAKKYKSAEEFIEAQSIYHGTSNNIEGGALAFGKGSQLRKGGNAGGLFLSDNPKIAEVFSFGGEVYQANPAIKSKVLDLTQQDNIKLFKDYIGKKYKSDGEMLEFTKQEFDYMFPEGKVDFATLNTDLAQQIAKKQGKIGVAFDEYAGDTVGKTYQIFEGEVPVYTKSQLKQIREEANKKGLKPKK